MADSKVAARPSRGKKPTTNTDGDNGAPEAPAAQAIDALRQAIAEANTEAPDASAQEIMVLAAEKLGAVVLRVDPSAPAYTKQKPPEPDADEDGEDEDEPRPWASLTKSQIKQLRYGVWDVPVIEDGPLTVSVLHELRDQMDIMYWAMNYSAGMADDALGRLVWRMEHRISLALELEEELSAREADAPSGEVTS